MAAEIGYQTEHRSAGTETPMAAAVSCPRPLAPKQTNRNTSQGTQVAGKGSSPRPQVLPELKTSEGIVGGIIGGMGGMGGWLGYP